MARLSLFFLIGTAMIGVIGMAQSGTAAAASAPAKAATIDVDVLMKLLEKQDTINIELFLNLIKQISTGGCLTSEVVQALVKASCSSATGKGIISVKILISLLNILKLVSSLLNGSLISIQVLIKIITTVIIGPTC